MRYYCVYASKSENVDVNDIKNCVGFAVKDTEFSYASSENLYFAVTAFDINYYESDPVVASLSGIADVNGAEKVEVVRYDACGRLLNKLVKGVNIVKYSNGEVKKEVVQ